MLIRYRDKFCIFLIFKLTICFVFCNNQEKLTIRTKLEDKVEKISSNISARVKEKVTIGFLTSFREGVGKTIAGAIPLAVDYVNAKEDLLPNHTMKFMTADIQRPYSATGLKSMLQFYKLGVNAFIGPEGPCISEALLATAFNLPMITYKCADKQASDKNIFKTFARTLPPSSKISKSIISLLKHFNWNRVVVVVNKNPTDLQIKDALLDLAQQHSISIIDVFYIKSPYLKKDNQTIHRIVDESTEMTRIYVLIAESHAAMEIVRYLYKTKQEKINEYALVLVEDEEYLNVSSDGQYFHKILLNEFSVEGMINYYNVSEAPFPFKTLLMITPSRPTNPNYVKFSDFVINKTKEVFKVPFHDLIRPEIPFFAGLAYDSVVIYAKALTRTLAEGGNLTDGERIMKNIFNLSYESILGHNDMIDLNGDASGSYMLLSLDETRKSAFLRMKEIGMFKKVENSDLPQLYLTGKIDWLNEDGAPKGEPVCGFNNEKCGVKLFLMITGIVVFIILFIALYFLFQHFRYELKLASKLWKVDFREVMVLNLNLTKNQTSQDVKNAISKFKKEAESQYAINIQLKNTFLEGKEAIGFFKGSIIFIKKLHRRNFDINRAMCKELIQLHEMRNENINPFIGISLEPNNICIFTMYCARGSLEDVLRNEDLKMDNMFIASLVADLIKGLIYLHYSENISHGNLKSSNCLVDSRWVLQITGFGLDEFRANPSKIVTKRQKASLLWKPPEVLRRIKLDLGDNCFNSNLVLKDKSPERRRKADIYSFAIILYEIVGRKGPWGNILNQRELQSENSYFRASGNLIKKKRFFTLADNEADLYDEPQIQRSFSDSISNNNNKFFLNNETNLKTDDNAEVSSICLGLEFKKDSNSQNSSTNHDHLNRSNNLRLKDFDLFAPKQIAVVRPKEHSVCMTDDFDQGFKLNPMRRKAIDSLLSSKKSLDERGNYSKNLNGKLKIEDIVDRVSNPTKYSNTIFRPDIQSLKDCPQYLESCIRLCWAERAETRPDMKQINSMLRQLQNGLRSNIFDNMIAILESHANNLEQLVEERTKQLVEEKKKTETLLLRMLPKPVADQLKRGQKVKAEQYENVTVYFSDICGFTELSFHSTPFQVVNLLNDLYTCFDTIISNYDVYKVETIGDAYMVVSGISSIIKETSTRHHSVEMALMALHLLDAIRNFTIRHRPGEQLKLRIGIHSGPVVSGVVGLKMPRYCLFGDTVNTASRMESTGEALKVHISESYKKNLDKHAEFVIEKRDKLTYIKGIGNMQTYFLLGYKKPELKVEPQLKQASSC